MLPVVAAGEDWEQAARMETAAERDSMRRALRRVSLVAGITKISFSACRCLACRWAGNSRAGTHTRMPTDLLMPQHGRSYRCTVRLSIPQKGAYHRRSIPWSRVAYCRLA